MANLHTSTAYGSSGADAVERRRHHDRYPAYFETALTDFGEQETPVAAFITNVSERGVRVMTLVAFQPGQVIKLQIADTELVGDVVYSNAAGDYFCTGLRLRLPGRGSAGVSTLLRAMWIESPAAHTDRTSNFERRTVSRRHLRYPVSGTVRVLWRHDDGEEGIISAKIENASEAGAKLRFDQMLPVRSYVSCNDESLGLRGTGSVRYCRFAKGKYDVGLDFGGDSGWRNPENRV
jgi:hypothetical protein